MVKQQRFYVDTSVWGAINDVGFELDTAIFFNMILKNQVVCLYSEIVKNELIGAPKDVKEFFTSFPNSHKENVIITSEVRKLADVYISEGVVGKSSMDDCVHIAAATVYNADVLVSWNFKHMVNFFRVKGYNAVNMRLGYPALDIRLPKEMLDYGT